MESSPPAAAAAPSPPPAPAPAPAEPAPAPLNGEESPRAASPPPAPAAPASPAAPPPVVGNATSPRGVKRRASRALSNSSDDFRGFAAAEAPLDDLLRCTSLVDKMAAEVAAEEAALTPVRSVTVTRAHKRLRTDTVESSRPSSALSHRSDDLLVSSSTDLASSAASSPAGGRGRRPETASPLLRTPLERGWKRELVYRAALDPHARRNADVYYYSPAGKKLRSNREVAEHIAGTDLTLDHFTFFKEPLGVDDPDKEIIRDAKLVRRVESPASSPAHTPSEGKRTPKPKQPKGASPVRSPVSVAGAVGAPPLKLKVKFGGSRLSSGGSGKSSAEKPSSRKSAPASGGPTGLAAATGPAAAATVNNNNGGSAGGAPWKKPTRVLVPPPPPLVCRPSPPPPLSPQLASPPRDPPALVQPCSMTCAGAEGAVPSLACSLCLCLYHPLCAGLDPALTAPLHHNNFLCKNCRVTSGPPPLTHKSGITVSAGSPPPLTPAPALQPGRRFPVPQPAGVRGRSPLAPAPAPAPQRRVLLRMKMQGGGGERVWSVQPSAAPAPTRHPPPAAASPRAAALPQSIAVINGRKFIVVPRLSAPPHQPQ